MNRTCVGCRTVRPAAELYRVGLTPAGSLAIGRDLPGRGAWLCRDNPECFDAALSRRAFDRAFRRRLVYPPIEELRPR